MKKSKKIFFLIFGIVLLAGVIISGIFASKTYKYIKAGDMMTYGSFDEAKEIYLSLGDFKDSATLIFECDYQKAGMMLENSQYDAARDIYVSLAEYKASSDLIHECDYQKAKSLLTNKSFDEARKLFDTISSYKDAKNMLPECDYEKASFLMDEGSYDIAKEQFLAIKGYKDSTDMIFKCDYRKALDILKAGSFDEAKALFETIVEYSNASDMVLECDYRKADALEHTGLDVEARDLFITIKDYSDAYERAKKIATLRGNTFLVEGEYEKAKEEYKAIPEDSDMKFLIKSCDMERVRKLCLNRKYNTAGALLAGIIDDDEFMEQYYGTASTHYVMDFKYLKPGTYEGVDCESLQYWKNGGAEVGKVYFDGKEKYDCFYYRVTKNGEFVEFVSFYPNGTCYHVD